MPDQEMHVVTGAFGFSGRYIARALLEQGRRVRTLTASPRRSDPFGGAVELAPFHWEDQQALIASLEGASVLYNTYWVRFNHATFSHAMAVVNTLKLFHAAKKAGVRRVVHVSITNPSESSPFEYFRCKAQLEEALGKSGLSHAILRPAVLFGKEDILVNNMAWALRRMPVVGVFGDGLYRLRPIYVGDLAELAVRLGQERADGTVDAVGPDTFTYRGLLEELGEVLGKRRPIVSVTTGLGFAAAKALGWLLGDVVLTRDEIGALTQELLYTGSSPAGSTSLSEWARQNARSLGLRYASELARRKDRSRSY
jgi:NADH dehydrogenase